VLRHRWSEDQQRIDLFIREGKVGLTLKHPNIVEILAVNQDPATKQYYLAMEFVEGGNLREILQARKTFDCAAALRIMDDAASGLAYAYSRGITHRDIKLTNLLISSQGEAKLVDFGLAQMFASVSRDDDQVDRTVDYAGLEKATNVKPGDVRSDIFFLGCVFFEMLTGRPPLAMSKDRHARMSKQRFEEVQSLKPGEINAPPSVYRIVETMMAFDPRQRYQTPSQLLEAVRDARRESGHVQPDPEQAAKGPASAASANASRPAHSVFVVESDERLQNAIRDKFKESGYRVFMAADPGRALDRFRVQPFDALVIDLGTVGEDGITILERIQKEGRDKHADCACIALLSEEQADWSVRVASIGKVTVMVRPVTLKQLKRKLQEVLGAGG
jgi:serine/threonine protein kinase